MNSTSTTPSYISYLTLVEQILLLFAQLTAVLNTGRLIHFSMGRDSSARLRSGSLSGTMLIFLFSLFLLSLLAIPYWTYIVVNWRFTAVYDPTLMFWLGAGA